MDASARAALAVALEYEFSPTVQGLFLERERKAMAFEDLSGQAMTGRVLVNPDLVEHVEPLTWEDMYEDAIDDLAVEHEEHDDEAAEREGTIVELQAIINRLQREMGLAVTDWRQPMVL